MPGNISTVQVQRRMPSNLLHFLLVCGLSCPRYVDGNNQ
jgi:hypothetical protein